MTYSTIIYADVVVYVVDVIVMGFVLCLIITVDIRRDCVDNRRGCMSLCS